MMTDNGLNSRQTQKAEESLKAEAEADRDADGVPMWHNNVTRTPRARNKKAKNQLPKTFFWSDLLNELNDKPLYASMGADSQVKRSPKIDKSSSISSEVLMDGYSLTECPFGHRRLVGTNVAGKEAINCRHCRYLITLHEQRNRSQSRRLNSEPSKSIKVLTSTLLPDIKECKSPECNVEQTTAKTAANTQGAVTEREQQQMASVSLATSRNRPSRRRFANIHKDIARQSTASLQNQVNSQAATHLYVAGTTTEMTRAEDKSVPTAASSNNTVIANIKSFRSTQATRNSDTDKNGSSKQTASGNGSGNRNGSGNGSGNRNGSGNGSGNGNAATNNKADRTCLEECDAIEIRIAGKEPPFYSVFANPFESGIPAALKERLVEMQRLELATVRREREEEARRRMKRARKHRAAAANDDADDDDG